MKKNNKGSIDIIMEQMKLNVNNKGSIDIINLDKTGENTKNRFKLQKQQIEELKKMLEKKK